MAMWSGERGTEEDFQGRHYRATRLLNSPQSLSRPRIPIMIGGGGEQKTLRLVAAVRRCLQRLRRAREDPPQVRGPARATARRSGGRSTRSSAPRSSRSTWTADGAAGAETPAQVTDRFAELGDAGAQHVLFSVRDVWQTEKLELLGRTVLTDLRGL